jgi:glycosyltransferase involved in cell wall biosynthesis
MHVLHLETGRHLYGGARQVLHLAEGLAAYGVRNTLVCAAGGNLELAARARDCAVVPIPMAGDLDPSAVFRLAKLIWRERPDLVHVHSRRGADTYGVAAARMLRVPVVLTRRVDNPDAPGVGAAKYWGCARVVAISHGVEMQLLRQGVPRHKLRLVRSAVDPAVCQPTWPVERFRKEFDLAPETQAIGVVAQLIPRKGHRYLIKALPQIRASNPQVRVILFGTGALEDKLRTEFARAGLDGMVRFAGYRPDLLDFLGHLTLLVHTAHREGLGIALLEAQAAGVPPVAFQVPGVSEAVADGETGLLVPSGAGDALAQAVTQLLWNPKRRAAMAAAGRQWVVENFSPERMVLGNLAVYRELLEGVAQAA